MNELRRNIGRRPEQTSSPGAGRLGEIEVLRAAAVLMVLLDHIPFNLVFWHARFNVLVHLDIGLWVGVDLFFAISGFVIARALLPQLEAVSDWTGFVRIAVPFWIARAWRLLPSSWLWLAVPLPLCVFFNSSNVYEPLAANWAMFVAGILDLANFHVVLTLLSGKVGTAFVQWSLSLEEQFYLLLPFAAFLLRGRLTFVLLLIAAAGFFVPNSALAFMVRLWPVALGVLLALWSRHSTYEDCAPAGLGAHRGARIFLFLLLFTCLICVGAPRINVVSFYQGPVAVISAIFVWLASYDRGYLWKPGLSRRVMEAIAARSYSLYLVHIPIYFAAHEIWYRLYRLAVPSRLQALVYTGLGLLAVVIIAELNHRLLETPLREYGKRAAAAYRARAAGA